MCFMVYFEMFCERDVLYFVRISEILFIKLIKICCSVKRKRKISPDFYMQTYGTEPTYNTTPISLINILRTEL